MTLYYAATLEQKVSHMSFYAVFYYVQNAIHHHYKESCYKLIKKLGLFSIIKAFQMSAMC